MRFKRLRRQREKEAKISNEENDFFTHKRRGRFFFYFGPKILFSTMLVCPSFPPQQEEKEKNFVERERETWQQKKERDFRFSLKRHTYKNHASSHIITTGVFFLLCDSTTLFCDTTFRFRARQLCQKKSFLFLLFETRCTRVRSSIVNTISIFIQRTTSGERFFL